MQVLGLNTHAHWYNYMHDSSAINSMSKTHLLVWELQAVEWHWHRWWILSILSQLWEQAWTKVGGRMKRGCSAQHTTFHPIVDSRVVVRIAIVQFLKTQCHACHIVCIRDNAYYNEYAPAQNSLNHMCIHVIFSTYMGERRYGYPPHKRKWQLNEPDYLNNEVWLFRL